MITCKNVGAAMLAIVAVAATGCATESSAFKGMSAVDHETAARSTADPGLAEAHAQAAARRRDEERADCYGVADADRDLGPFGRSDGVSGVRIVRDHGAFPKEPLHPVGVAVDLRAESGLTQQWLGRVVACHLAHVAVVGQGPRPSPLTVPKTDVTISSTDVGFRVTITSRDPETARSVIERGHELAEASPTTIAWY